jgi:CDP-diacylglycerol--glycerol-3-phosphate 3-phosphatidyltransferase
MTFATKITLGRLLLIPVFIGLALQYGRTVRSGAAVEAWRWAAVVVFGIASLSDWVDGYIARRWNQRSRLGAILDPLADKGLVLAAVISLSVAGWQPAMPLWFPLLAITRDSVILIFVFLIHHFGRDLKVKPSWWGKTATIFQMVTISWVMLGGDGLTGIPVWVPAALASFFVTVSGFDYLFYGLHLLQAEAKAPDSQEDPPN